MNSFTKKKPEITGITTKTIAAFNISKELPSVVARCANGPTRPLNPNPALIAVPLMSSIAANTPETAALHRTGSIIFGLAKILAIEIFGDPIKCAKQTPLEFTAHPAIASVNPHAQIPRFAAPEAIPSILIASATPTDVIGETTRHAKITAIRIVRMIGCNVSRCLIPSPKSLVTPEKNGRVYLPIPPIITSVNGGKMITA